MFAVLTKELAEILIDKGYRLVNIREGSFLTVYYFEEEKGLHEEVEKFLFL